MSRLAEVLPVENGDEDGAKVARLNRIARKQQWVKHSAKPTSS